MRKSKAKPRKRQPDSKFNNTIVTFFVNNLMLGGKKSTAFKIFYDSLDLISEKTKDQDGFAVWKKALDNVMPDVEVKSRRIGGATFQIPTPVSEKRKLSLGTKWIIKHARGRKGKHMKTKLADELIAASNEEGSAFKKKVDTHKMAEANKAFSHFRF
tara:strand:+ start:367 stop:837 length:471 start_codon:yes stop_codon:yes gene_type:complete